MAGSSNFLRFDPSLNDTLSDNAYSLNGQRLNGLQTGIAPTALHNKYYVQQSTMTAAIGQVLADQGFNVSDSDYPGLVSALATLIGSNATAVYPKDYATGNPPYYNAATSVIIPTGLGIRSSDDSVTIIAPSDLLVNLNSSGANGLDTGVKNSNTWYYLYLIRKSSDGTVAGLWSTVNEKSSGSIILPAGYDQKAQTRTAWSTNGASNLRYVEVVEWGARTLMRYNDTIVETGMTGPLTILANGVASPYTTLNCASLIPPCSTYGLFHFVVAGFTGSPAVANFRTTGFTNDGILLVSNSNISSHSQELIDKFVGLYAVNSSQQIDYQITPGEGGNASIQVLGYLITGM